MVTVTLDRIAQVPSLELVDAGTPDIKTGTKIVVHWRGIASYLTEGIAVDLQRLVKGCLPCSASAVTVGGSSCSTAASKTGVGIVATRSAVTFWRSESPACVAACVRFLAMSASSWLDV